MHAVLEGGLRGVTGGDLIAELHELRGGLLLGRGRGDFVLKLRCWIVSVFHRCDYIAQLHVVWHRNVPSSEWW